MLVFFFTDTDFNGVRFFFATVQLITILTLSAKFGSLNHRGLFQK